jgi:amino acid adenylation domain-containing protein
VISTIATNLPLGVIDETLKADKQYWLRKLSGDLALSGLQEDLPRTAASHGWSELPMEFPRDVVLRVRALCGNNEMLIFSFLLSAVKICLHKYTDQQDIIVGTPVHDSQGETGILNRVLALRDSLTAQMTVREVMNSVKTTLGEAYTHQKYPFTRLLDLLGVQVEDSQQAIFKVFVTHDRHNTGESDPPLADVCLHFHNNAEALSCTIQFDHGLFTRQTIEVFGRHLVTLAQQMIANTSERVAGLSLVSLEEAALIQKFNNTRREYPRNVPVHQLFELQANLTPSQPALIHGRQTWSYERLNHESNRLARYLREVGVRAGVRVGVLMDRSAEMFTALLGVLKAGATYLPLDPEVPPVALSHIVQDAGLHFVLTQDRHAGKLPSQVEALAIDGHRCQVRHECAGGNLNIPSAPDQIAYVLYTSGSTGSPKGVEVTHHGLTNYVCWAVDQYFRSDKLGVAFYSSIAFDLTVTSLFCPLICGGRIVIYDGEIDEIVTQLASDDVGFIKVTPSHLMFAKENIASATSLRRIVVGGEAFHTALAREIHRTLGEEVEIFNEYGPTEATVGCMVHRFDPERESREQVPIGVPAANTQIYLLDQNLQPVSLNMTGEIYIGGEGLAHGYLNLPEVSSRSFIENPFRPGERLYRTGDLARWLPEWELEYVGRKDGQVKFHGYRIELDDIRAHLNQFPGIKDNVISVHKDNAGSEVMVAHYAADQEFPALELKSFLKQRFTDVLVPGFFVWLKKLPLTDHGKLDRRALPGLAEIRKLRHEAETVAPRTPTEEVLLGIWCQVMEAPNLSIHDDFFASGGHSLLAVRVISRARKVLGVALPLRSLFEAPTVARLAAVIDSSRHGKEGLHLPALVRRTDKEGASPLSYGQKRVWFAQQINPDSAVYNIYPAFRLRGKLDIECLTRALNEIIARHEILRTNFLLGETGPVQVVSPQRYCELPVIDLSRFSHAQREAELAAIVSEDGQHSFDLAADLLLRAKIVRLEEFEHVLLIAFHHIIADAWSMQIFYRELSSLYSAFLAGGLSPLPQLSLQYRDYVAWQECLFAESIAAEELAYWREKLRNVPAEIVFNNSRTRPMVAANRGEALDVSIGNDLSRQLRELSRTENCTMFMLMLAAYKTWLCCYSGVQDIVVGIDIANRAPSETEDLIGFFVNLLPIRTDLSDDPAFHELVARIRANCLDAYSHQYLPFEKIVEDLNPERRGDRIPFVPATFGLLPANPIQEFTLPGIELTLMGRHNSTSVFDFTLLLVEGANGLTGCLQYSSELFEPGTVVRMLASFQTILQTIVKRPEIKLSDLRELVADSERMHLATSARQLKKDRLQTLASGARRG